MRLKAYQAFIAAGVLTIIVLQVLRHGAAVGPNRSLDETLQLTGSSLCLIGIVVGLRSLRRRYGASGFDRKTA